MFKKIKKAIGGKGKKEDETEVVAAESSPSSAVTTEVAPDPVPAPAAEIPAPALDQHPASNSAPLADPTSSAAPSPPPAPAPPPPKARITPPPAPAPRPQPTPAAKRNIANAPVKSAAVVTGQGTSEDEKISTIVPGGIPAPEWAVARSNKPKEDHFREEAALTFIRHLVDVAPAGLLGSLVGDIQDVAYAYMDVNFLQELQKADQTKKGLAQAAVAHAIGDALQQELAAYQKEKYASRGVTSYKDMRWGLTANEFYVTTHAEMLDGNNSRTGSWTARWKVTCENIPGVSTAEISGAVEARSWCYEGCTAHMFSSQSFDPVTVQADVENPLARVLKNQIAQWEKQVIEALNTVYGDQMDGTLKAIRRTLPITRTRLKWELIANRAVKSREKKKAG